MAVSIGDHFDFNLELICTTSEFFKKLKLHEPLRRVQFSAFWKTRKCKLISNWTRKTVWLLSNNTNMKKSAQEKCRKMFLEAGIFFAFEKTFFRVAVEKFCHCFNWYHWPTKFLIFFLLILIQSYDISVICVGVTLFALVLHLNCTALSQSESSNFFMCIIAL